MCFSVRNSIFCKNNAPVPVLNIKVIPVKCENDNAAVLSHTYTEKLLCFFFQELEQRKWPKVCKLGLQYHMHGVIGAYLIKWCVTVFTNINHQSLQ